MQIGAGVGRFGDVEILGKRSMSGRRKLLAGFAYIPYNGVYVPCEMARFSSDRP